MAILQTEIFRMCVMLCNATKKPNSHAYENEERNHGTKSSSKPVSGNRRCFGCIGLGSRCSEVYTRIDWLRTFTDGRQTGCKKTALDTAIYGSPGLDRSMRLSAISGAGNDAAIAKVVGYEPNRGTRIDSMAAGKLKALIQKVMLDLNVSTGDKRTKEAQELLERSFRTKFTLLEQDLVDEFRLMIKAYHEVRLMNLPYIESMMVGMDGAEFPDVLLSMLAPSPDDFLQGTDAMLIIDSKNRPEEDRIQFSGITDTILSLWSRILNTRQKTSLFSPQTNSKRWHLYSQLSTMTGQKWFVQSKPHVGKHAEEVAISSMHSRLIL